MTGIVLQVTYRDGAPFSAYIYLTQAQEHRAARSQEVAPEIVVDFDADGRPIGVELVSPDATDLDELLAVFDTLGLRRPDPRELAPLRAA